MSEIVRPPKIVVSSKPMQAPPTQPEPLPPPPPVPVTVLLAEAKLAADKLAAAVFQLEDVELVREDRNAWRAQAIEKEAAIAAKDKELAELRLLLEVAEKKAVKPASEQLPAAQGIGA